ncbi:hypothetical protein OG895_41855 [Streptomyces sp. NBC_00201]|nr:MULTISPECIES: hypothetical protein [unclassified Streptomyces]MCX5251634.1 hypothetical protein [Streptomyces sp. NBC_00201]
MEPQSGQRQVVRQQRPGPAHRDVTNDLYWARNTLTHLIQGPTSTATIQLDYATMRDGDRAGLALLRDSSAWIGIKQDGGTTRLVMVNGLTMDSNWNTTGTEVASANVTGGRIRLRAAADIRPGASRPGTFSHSTDGTNFTRLGPAFTMGNTWQFFMGYRFALTNYATQTLGGSVGIARFALTTPRAQQRPSPASDQLLSPRPATPGRTTPWPVPPSTGQRLTRPQ